MKSEELDKKIRSAIGRREIDPGSTSWDRLESMLDADQQKGKASYTYMKYAAAVIVVLVMVASIVNRPWDRPVTEDAVVESPEGTTVESAVPMMLKDVPAKGLPEVETTDNTVAGVENSHDSDPDVPGSIVTKNELKEDAVLREPVTRISLEPANTNVVYMKPVEADTGSAVSQREIDALLAEARAALDSADHTRLQKVNALELLADIEEELDQNFKDKALDALKKGIVKLKTAVAERNQ